MGWCHRCAIGVAALLYGCAVAAGASKAFAAERGPNLDAAVLRSLGGRLAFVWRKALYLADGSRGSARRVAVRGTIDELRWSEDGATLALRIGDHVWTVPRGALQARRLSESCPPPRPFRVVPPPQTSRCDSLASPDGGTLVWARTLPYRDPVTRSDALVTSRADGTGVRERYVAHEAGIILAGWVRPHGVAFWWDAAHSASLAADGLPLMMLALDGTALPRMLATTLPYAEWLAWSPSRGRALIVAGGPRIAWHGKSLERCSLVAILCHDVLSQPGEVSIDPAWSPSGSRVAFVRAKDLGESTWGFSPRSGLQSWIATRTLWVANADGSHAGPVLAAGRGVYRPAWSRDGTQILFVRNDALWTLRLGDAAPVRVLGPFPDPPDPMGEYGHVDWSAQFAWTPASGSSPLGAPCSRCGETGTRTLPSTQGKRHGN